MDARATECPVCVYKQRGAFLLLKQQRFVLFFVGITCDFITQYVEILSCRAMNPTVARVS